MPTANQDAAFPSVTSYHHVPAPVLLAPPTGRKLYTDLFSFFCLLKLQKQKKTRKERKKDRERNRGGRE